MQTIVSATLLVATTPLLTAAPALARADTSTAGLGSTAASLLAAAHRLSPRLRQAALETEATQARADAAGALADPVFSTSYQNYHSPNLFSMFFITLSQEFPLWGKRDLRHQAALAEVDAARGRERAVRDELDEKLKVAYARYHAVARAITINRDILALARRMQAAANARFGQGTGEGTGQETEPLLAMTEQTRAEADGVRLDEERAATVALINALLARPAGATLAPPLRPRPVPSVIPPLASLLDRARAGNPLLSADTAAIRGAETERQLAGKAWLPGVVIGGGPIAQTNAPTGYTATVTFSIPLQQGPKEAGLREAAARLNAARMKRDATLAEIQGDLQQALAQLAAARRLAVLLRTRLLPQYQATYKVVLAGYGQGHGDLDAALEAEHRLHATDLELLRTETEEQTALAAVERLIGGDL